MNAQLTLRILCSFVLGTLLSGFGKYQNNQQANMFSSGSQHF